MLVSTHMAIDTHLWMCTTHMVVYRYKKELVLWYKRKRTVIHTGQAIQHTCCVSQTPIDGSSLLTCATQLLLCTTYGNEWLPTLLFCDLPSSKKSNLLQFKTQFRLETANIHCRDCGEVPHHAPETWQYAVAKHDLTAPNDCFADLRL